MNVLYLTGHLWDADFVEHELGKIAPHIHVDVSPKHDDALERIVVPGRYDAVLLDPALPGGESLALIARIRERDLPLAVVVMVSHNGEDPPLRMLEAGADDYVVKRPHFVKNLPSLLQRAVDRRRAAVERSAHPLYVLYAGDMENGRRYFSSAPLIKLEAATFAPDRSWRLPEAVLAKAPYDAVVIDSAISWTQVLRLVKEITARCPDTPVVLLIDPMQDDISAQALKIGTVECVVKSGDYVQHLVPSLENAVRRRDLAREKAALRSTEVNLRMLVENIPACVTLLTCSGIFQAMNWAGLSLVGATRVDQIVGKNLYSMVSLDYQDKLRSFIARVCAGEKGVTEFEWDGLDGIPRRLELRAVPLRRESEAAPAVLGVIQDLGKDRRHELAAASPKEEPQIGIQPEKSSGFTAGEVAPVPAAELNASQESRKELQEEPPSITVDQASDRQEFEGRIAALEEALRIAKAECARVEGEQHAGRGEWDAERIRHEEDRLALQAAARTAETNLTQAEDQHRIERAEWEKTRQEFEQRQSEEVAQRGALEKAVQELQARLTEIEDHHQVEAAGWERLRREMQQQLAESEGKHAEEESRGTLLEEKLYEREARYAELAEKFEAERGASNRAIQELERQRQEQQARIATLEAALAAADGRACNLQQEYQVQQADWKGVRANLERGIEAFESELRELQARHTEVMAQIQVDRAGWEAARRELVRRHETAEMTRTALASNYQTVRARLAELEELRRTEAAVWAKARQEQEQQIRDLESRIGMLERALSSAEANRTKLLEEQRLDREKLEKSQEEIKHQRETRVALEDCLHTSETRRVGLEDERQAERAEWQSIKEELERERRARLAKEEELRVSEARLAELPEEDRSRQTELDALRQEIEGQRTARLALERALRAAEAPHLTEPNAELATLAVQTLAELVRPMSECGKMLMENLDENDPRRLHAVRLVEISNQVRKLASPLSNLRPTGDVLDLNLMVTEITDKFRHLTGEGVELLTMLSSPLPRILAPRIQVEQLLVALVTQARDSLPLGGTVTVDTRLSVPDEAQGAGPAALLSVTASGCAVQGCGESSALESLVAECGGKLSITGGGDIGTTIEVLLPAEVR